MLSFIHHVYGDEYCDDIWPNRWLETNQVYLIFHFQDSYALKWSRP